MEYSTDSGRELNGQQGFGKSLFLHCLALKWAFEDNLVVWVPACPTSLAALKEASATGFYCGCQARKFGGIPCMIKLESGIKSLEKMEDFAQGKN
jgi:hypothetical protein